MARTWAVDDCSAGFGDGAASGASGRAASVGLFPRNFHICHLQIGKRVTQYFCLFASQVAARFFLNHRQLIDEHPGQVEVHFALAGFWIWNLAKEQRGVLRVHHDKFDEALRKLAAQCGFLDFSHGSFLFRSCGPFRRSHRRQNIRLIAKIFRSHLFNILERHRVHIVLKLLVIIKAQSVELVERAMITESVVALIGDLLLPNQFLFRSRQFFSG